jgi:hypothetical protein
MYAKTRRTGKRWESVTSGVVLAGLRTPLWDFPLGEYRPVRSVCGVHERMCARMEGAGQRFQCFNIFPRHIYISFSAVSAHLKVILNERSSI